MKTILLVLVALSLPAAPVDPKLQRVPDLTLLQEMLRDRQNPRGQSQAALMLVQSGAPEADAIIRQGLQQSEDPELFLALALALRLNQDTRFFDELLPALASNRPTVRQAAADTLALSGDPRLLPRLRALVDDTRADLASRQAAVWVLGRGGRKQAVPVLLEQLDGEAEPLRKAAAEALAELSGQNYGLDVTRWQTWWDRHKDLSTESWLESRLAYQSARARRLEGELERSRSQVLRLHQQVYARLPAADRLGYLPTVLDHDDPAVRSLAVSWVVEELATADAARQQALVLLLLKLTQDGTIDVQRAAVLALGRVNDQLAFDRLTLLLQQGRASVRAAAARSLAQQARGHTPEGLLRQRLVVPALQKALDDPALEVVVEVAEALGMLGALEAGPVLTGLLQHPAGHVRQTAAQALERVADSSLVDGMIKGLSDPSVNVRFSLLGALARAVGQGAGLGPMQQGKLLNRLEVLLLRDGDPGVRSRAATVLGEFAPPAVLPLLWKCVLGAEDARVQENAWTAFVEVLVRSANLALLQEWDQTLAAGKQDARRLQLLTDVGARWQKGDQTLGLAAAAQELLVQALLAQKKWSAALVHVREMLPRPGTAAEVNQRLRLLLTIGELALQEGNQVEVVRIVTEARPYLQTEGELAQAFEQLGKKTAP